MRYYNPKKSGVHRAACRSLYRAILRALAYQDATIQPTLQTIVQGRFHRDAKLQSPTTIKLALKDGETGLQLLTRPGSLSASDIQEYKKIISTRPAPRPPSLPSTREVPRVWPYPGAKPYIESHPIPTSELPPGKKRNLPSIVLASSGLPFLRFKPQSPYLSRIIRNRLEQHQRRIDMIQRLETESEVAQAEDMWDEVLWRYLANADEPMDMEQKTLLMQELQEARDRRNTWVSALTPQLEDVKARIVTTQQARNKITEKLWEIYRAERELKVEEEGEDAVRLDEELKGRGLWHAAKGFKRKRRKPKNES